MPGSWYGFSTNVGIDSFAVDDSYLYWPEPEANAIARVAKVGGATELFTTLPALPIAVAVNSTSVFWTDVEGDDHSLTGHSLTMMAKAGGTPQTLYHQANPGSYMASPVANETRVFLTQEDSNGPNDVISVGIANQDVLVHGQAGKGNNFLTGFNIALDADAVYWISAVYGNGDNSISRSPLMAPTTSQQLASTRYHDTSAASLGIAGPVVLDGVVYFLNDTSIMSVPATGGDPTTVYRVPGAPGAPAPLNDAFFTGAGNNLYFAKYSLSPRNVSLWRVGTDGTNAQQLFNTSGDIVLAVADSSGVYALVKRDWLSGGAFFLLRSGI